VVKVGAGKKKEDSEEMVKPNVEVGQTVMYSKYSGTEFEVCICISVRAFLCVPMCNMIAHDLKYRFRGYKERF